MRDAKKNIVRHRHAKQKGIIHNLRRHGRIIQLEINMKIHWLWKLFSVKRFNVILFCIFLFGYIHLRQHNRKIETEFLFANNKEEKYKTVIEMSEKTRWLWRWFNAMFHSELYWLAKSVFEKLVFLHWTCVSISLWQIKTDRQTTTHTHTCIHTYIEASKQSILSRHCWHRRRYGLCTFFQL